MSPSSEKCVCLLLPPVECLSFTVGIRDTYCGGGGVLFRFCTHTEQGRKVSSGVGLGQDSLEAVEDEGRGQSPPGWPLSPLSPLLTDKLRQTSSSAHHHTLPAAISSGDCHQSDLPAHTHTTPPLHWLSVTLIYIFYSILYYFYYIWLDIIQFIIDHVLYSMLSCCIILYIMLC